MRRIILIVLTLAGGIGSVSAQYDDMYFVPKKKKNEAKVDGRFVSSQVSSSVQQESEASMTLSVEGLEMDEDTYNRRGSYVTEQGDAVSGLAITGKEIAVVTEDGDTLVTNSDTLRLTRVNRDEGWVNGFEGSDSDYEYAMRIVRFRNPRYAIPVSSPLYWDVVYGGTLWPSWEWNIYDDGMFAYVFPTSSNWYYWDYMVTYPFGWSAWSNPWTYHHGFHWGHHWNSHYAHVWYDPCFGPGWHFGHHHGFHPGFGSPSWRQPKAHPNYRSAMAATTRRSGQTGNVATQRIDNGSSRNVSSRSASGRTGTVSRSSGTVSSSRSSSRTAVGDDVIRRSTGSSSVSRSTSNGSSRSNSSYSRPSSTRSSSSSVSRSSSSGSSRSGSSYGSGSSSRSSSYSSGSSSRSSSYSSGGGARSGGSSSRSSGSRR